MNISEQERLAIKQVLSHGERHGYGNMICHLQTAWAEKLMREYEFSEKEAREATTRDGRFTYPFQMQKDLIERGCWDETGERYRGQGGDATARLIRISKPGGLEFES